MSERRQVSFLASLPPIQSAVKVSGNGDGMRVQIDVPESEMPNAIDLLAWRGKVLRVTVEVDSLKNSREQQDAKRETISTRPKRKSEWKAAEESGLD